MAYYWLDENKKYGFYLIGFFEKGQMAKFMVDTMKPFEINNITGEVRGRCICGIPHNRFVTEWLFFEGYKIKDIDKNIELRKSINETWQFWCKNHKRKYHPIMNINPIKEAEK